LITKAFKKEERSGLGYLLHVYWILLAAIDLVDFFLIGYIWDNIQDIPRIVQKYLSYAVGPVVIGDATAGTLIEPELAIQSVQIALLGLTIASVLVALGLFLRRPLAHTLGLVLIALHLLIGLMLLVTGFLGYVMAAFRALLTVMLTVFMFNTVEDFSKEERRERLELDRRAVNDADFYARGRAYEKRGMWAKALLHWQKAVAINPGRDTYYASMARAYARLGWYEQAVAQIEEARRVSRTPEEWQTLHDIIVEARRRATALS
jgi:tetratricopeptide (TPR) repeat protein